MNQHSLFGSRSSASRRGLCLGLGVLLTSAALSQADTVVGLFSNPDLIGTLDNPFPMVQYNVPTAEYAIFNYTSVPQNFGSVVEYGTTLLNGQLLPLQGGSLSFQGKDLPADPSQTFDLGTFNFHNGEALPNTVIFGATLTLVATPDGTINAGLPQGASHITLFTSADYDSANNPLSGGADYLTISGVVNQFAYVPEGGFANLELFGRIEAGHLLITDYQSGPQSSAGVYVGEGSPVPAPEPSSLLAGLAVLGLIGFESFRRQRPAASAQPAA